MKTQTNVVLMVMGVISMSLIAAESNKPTEVSLSVLERSNAAYIFPVCGGKAACPAARGCTAFTCGFDPTGHVCVRTGGVSSTAPVAGATIGSCTTQILPATCPAATPCGGTTVPLGCNEALGQGDIKYCTSEGCGGAGGLVGC